MLFRWFVGLMIDERVFDASTFSKNRDRLLTHEIAQEFLSSLLGLPEVKRLMSAEHFSVDGTLLKAWASMKSFRPKGASDEGPGTAEATAGRMAKSTSARPSDRTRPTPRRRTRRRALTAKRRAGEPSRRSWPRLDGEPQRALAAAEATLATGTAEREAAAPSSSGCPRARPRAKRGTTPRLSSRACRRAGSSRTSRSTGRRASMARRARPPSRARSPRVCAMRSVSGCEAHRGRLRLDEDGRRSHAGEGAWPRQDPRRFRLRHGRLQHRPPAQAPGPEGRSASGGLKSHRTMTRKQARTSKSAASAGKKSRLPPRLRTQ